MPSQAEAEAGARPRREEGGRRRAGRHQGIEGSKIKKEMLYISWVFFRRGYVADAKYLPRCTQGAPAALF